MKLCFETNIDQARTRRNHLLYISIKWDDKNAWLALGGRWLFVTWTEMLYCPTSLDTIFRMSFTCFLHVESSANLTEAEVFYYELS